MPTSRHSGPFHRAHLRLNKFRFRFSTIVIRLTVNHNFSSTNARLHMGPFVNSTLTKSSLLTRF